MCAFMNHFAPNALYTVFYSILPTNIHSRDHCNLIYTQEETQAQRFKYHDQDHSTSKCQRQNSNSTVSCSKVKFSTLMLSSKNQWGRELGSQRSCLHSGLNSFSITGPWPTSLKGRTTVASLEILLGPHRPFLSLYSHYILNRTKYKSDV